MQRPACCCSKRYEKCTAEQLSTTADFTVKAPGMSRKLICNNECIAHMLCACYVEFRLLSAHISHFYSHPMHRPAGPGHGNQQQSHSPAGSLTRAQP